jgi:hypothetical protein
MAFAGGRCSGFGGDGGVIDGLALLSVPRTAGVGLSDGLGNSGTGGND